MKVKDHTYSYDQHFSLEAGDSLPGFQLRYSTLGNLNSGKSNVIWVCHALTGSSSFMDWWGDLFTPDGPFNPEQHFIICVNTLGGCYGSTGPLSVNPETDLPYFHDFPLITNRDIIKTFDLLRVYLGLERVHTLIGGSLGGQQALEWAVLRPYTFQHLIPIACNASHSPWGIAVNESQRMAIEADSSWGSKTVDAGSKGLAAARAMSMVTFRAYQAYGEQQRDENPKLDLYKASAYQQYQGDKLVKRFNAFSYWTLTKVMDSHNVGRDGDGVQSALGKIQSSTLVVGVDSDLLFPLAEQELISNAIPNAQLEVIRSDFGHDAFLIETKKLKSVIYQFYKKQSKYIFQ